MYFCSHLFVFIDDELIREIEGVPGNNVSFTVVVVACSSNVIGFLILFFDVVLIIKSF